MSWKETSPGLYQRPVGGAEKIMVAAIAAENPPSREPFQIQAIVDFTALYPSENVTKALRDAWKALRLLKSPDIATTFGDWYKYYKVPTSQELEAWLDQTFTVAQTGTGLHTAVRDMQLRLEFLPVCYILPQPTEDGTFKGSIILFISHWRTEASGAFKIINQLLDYASDILSGTSTLEALSNHTLGNEVQLLTPALEDLLMPDQQSTPVAKARVNKQFTEYSSKLPCIDFPIQGDLSASPSYVKLNHRIYTPSATSNLVSACRAAGISVTAAVQSAYIEAAYQLTEPSHRHRSFANMMPAQVRKRLPASSPARDQGCWNAVQMLALSTPPGQDFLTRARDLRQQYGVVDRESWMHEDMRELSEQAVNFLSRLTSGPSASPHFTSIGVLDGDVIVPEHGGLTVDYVTVWADNMGPGFVLGVWTFKGSLNLQISWNVAFHGDAQVQQIMDIIDKTLVDGLNVKMELQEVRGKDGYPM